MNKYPPDPRYTSIFIHLLVFFDLMAEFRAQLSEDPSKTKFLFSSPRRRKTQYQTEIFIKRSKKKFHHRDMFKNEKSEILSEEEINLILQRTLRRTDCRVNNYNVQPVSNNPAGFLGEHLKVKIEAIVDNGEISEFSYFVKRIPTSLPQHLEYAKNTRAFYKEIELYTTLFVDFANAQNNPTKWSPEFYFSRGHEMFVLEDLNALGYYMLPDRILMDENHIKASLRAMASMHAATFIFEDKFRRGVAKTVSANRGKCEGSNVTAGDLYSNLTFETETSDEIGHPGNTFCEVGIKSQCSIVDLMNSYSASEKRKIKEKMPSVLRRTFKLVKPSDKFKNVFIHGDLWSNNLLFRKDKNGELENAIIIDFQLARYGPPAHDLMMFLHLVQNRQFRARRQSAMLDYYYDSLSKELEKNEIAVESVLPRHVFDQSCEYYTELGLLESVLYFQLILASPDIVGKIMTSPELYQNTMLVDRGEILKECFAKDEIFRLRMTEAMEDIIRAYILNEGTPKTS